MEVYTLDDTTFVSAINSNIKTTKIEFSLNKKWGDTETLTTDTYQSRHRNTHTSQKYAEKHEWIQIGGFTHRRWTNHTNWGNPLPGQRDIESQGNRGVDLGWHKIHGGDNNCTTSPLVRGKVGNSEVNNQWRGSRRQENTVKDDRDNNQQDQ